MAAPSTQATRVTTGFVKALSLTGVADGTEVHGWNNWQVFDNTGAHGLGLFEVRSGELRSKTTTTWTMAIWRDPDVKLPGHCVVAEVNTSNYLGNPVPGLVANAYDEAGYTHSASSADIRCMYYNQFEFRARAALDYGGGSIITSGNIPGQPFVNNTWYQARIGAVQQTPSAAHTRGSVAFNNQIAAADNGLGTGINDLSDTCPGIVTWFAAGSRWRNYYVTRDYRLSVIGLTGTQGFRLYNASGTVVKSSSAQSGNEAHVNIIDLTWPFVGYLQIFNDAGTWASPVSGRGRWPELSSGNATDIYGGDIIELPSFTQMVQVNWDDTAAWPAFWTDPASKDVTLDVADMLIDREAANPDVGQDTLTLTLRDPTRKYVPAKTTSSLYPNLRLNRKVRVVIEINGTYYPLFYGTIGGYKPAGNFGERHTVIRAESPLRAIANNQTRPSISAAVVSVDDSNGAVAEVLDAISDLVPVNNRDLDAAPDTVPDDMQVQWGSPGEALANLAILTDSLWFARPEYRVLTTDPDWSLVFQYRDAKVAVAADWTWDAATDGMTWDVEYTDDA